MSVWKGFKEFIVSDKVAENEYIYSFYLTSPDDEKLPDYLPGQFIAIRVQNEDGTWSRPRQYTLSSVSNGKYFKISVKREPEGDVSKKLCDTVHKGDLVKISAPTGKFVLKDDGKSVVFIGGGIGITPMLTMAYKAVESHPAVHLIYSSPNSNYHAFEEEIEKLANNHENLKITTVYTRPLLADEAQRRFDLKGRLSKEWLQENVNLNSVFYFCGPVEFMRSIYHYLIELGVTPENIHYELFAPGQDITKSI